MRLTLGWSHVFLAGGIACSLIALGALIVVLWNAHHHRRP